MATAIDPSSDPLAGIAETLDRAALICSGTKGQ